MPDNIFDYGLGAHKDVEDSRDIPYAKAALAAMPETLAELPAYVDNRALFGPVFDQKKEGACVGMSVAAAANRLFYDETIVFSPRWAYWYARFHDEIPGEAYEGSTIRGGLKAWNKLGICPWDFWPYEPYAEGGRLAMANEKALDYPLARYERLDTHQQVLHAVAEDGCVLATIEIHSGWRKPTDDKHRIKYSTSYREYGLHAITIVGDDNNTGHWLVRNSWGTDWGDEGHAWLKYDDYHDNATDVWRAMAVEVQ